MKRISPKFFTPSIFILFVIFQIQSQNYMVELSSNVSTKETLPFFLRANKFGAVPNENNLSLNTSIFSNFKGSEQLFDFSYKASITGFIAGKSDVFINELYGSFLFKNIQIDLGSKNDEILFEGLSVSNGNIIKSINSRAIPGINIKTRNYFKLPFAKNWLRAKVNYSEYFLNDKRAVDNAHLHYKSLYFKSKLSETFNLIAGLDHYVQWGGTSKEFGKQPSDFKHYLKYITGQGDGINTSEAINSSNAFGNHIGNYKVQLDYKGTLLNWNFYWSHLFEDASGRELSNYPDALYGLFIDLKKTKSLITHIITEFQYTKHQGRATSLNGLIDNYFNNLIYKSGWTYFGNTIGSPFFTPKPQIDGITYGIAQSRFTSFNFGFKGFLTPYLEYKTNLTYTKYAGYFGSPINKGLFSPYLEFHYQKNNFPFEMSLGITNDFGDFLPNNFGGFFKLSKTGKF